MLVYIHYLTGIQLSPRNWIRLLSQSPDLMTLMLLLFCGFTGFVVFVILSEINRYIYSNLICIHLSSCCFRKPINFFSGLSYKTFVSMIWYHLLLGKWWLGFKVFRFSYVEEKKKLIPRPSFYVQQPVYYYYFLLHILETWDILTSISKKGMYSWYLAKRYVEQSVCLLMYLKTPV